MARNLLNALHISHTNNPVGDKLVINHMHNTIDALIELIHKGDEADRCFASQTLGVLQDKRAIPTLIEHLRDEDIDVCIDAAEALGRINDQQAIPALLESLKNDPNGEVKSTVTEALGHFGSKAAMDALLQLAAGEPEDMIIEEDDDWNDWWDMQLKSVKALGIRREARAVAVLKKLLLEDEAQDIEAEIYKSLAQIGGDGMDALVAVLQTSGERSRRLAIHALGHSEDPRTHKILGRGLKDKHASVRAAAMAALSRLKAVNYLGTIVNGLKDEDAEVRHAALAAISKLGRGRVHTNLIPTICHLLKDSNKDVLANSLNLLNRLINNEHNDQLAIQNAITDSDRDNIIQCLQHEDFTIQAAACTLLDSLKQHNAQDNLQLLANDVEQHAMARREAINALSGLLLYQSENIHNELINHYSRWILDESQPVRLAAISNLLKLNELVNKDLPVGPLEIVISAAKGELPLENKDSSSLYSSEKLADIGVRVEQQDIETTSTADHIEYNPLESELDKQQSQQSAMSTLEALTMDNVEIALMSEQAVKTNAETLSAEEQAEYQEYFDLLENNKKRGEKMKAPKIESKTDARYLALRCLGLNSMGLYSMDLNSTAEVIDTLILTLSDEDKLARHESIKALGQIANSPNPPIELSNALGRLITLMHSDVEDNRLASVQTLGNMRHRAAIAEIINHLNDEDYHVRLHSVHALAKLCQHLIDQIGDDPDHMMVISNMTIEETLKAIANALDDAEPGVKMAAVESLLALRSLNQQDIELEKIIQIALDDQGALTRRIAQLIRHGHCENAASILLNKMQASEDSAHRRFIIEMLEELYKPEILAA